MIAEGTVVLLSAESGSGKTTLMTVVAHAVSKGIPFAGLATARKPVLMLDKENPLSVVRERLERLGIEDDDEFRIWGGWCPGEVPAANSPIIADWVKACEVKPLLIVDSLVAYLEGSENDSAEIRKHMDSYRDLANRGATVVVLHHAGKGESSKEYRGSSDIKGSVDLAYTLTNLGDPARLSMLRLKAFKSRFAAVPELILSYRDGAFHAGEQHEHATVFDLLVELLRGNPGVKATEFEGWPLTRIWGGTERATSSTAAF